MFIGNKYVIPSSILYFEVRKDVVEIISDIYEKDGEFILYMPQSNRRYKLQDDRLVETQDELPSNLIGGRQLFLPTTVFVFAKLLNGSWLHEEVGQYLRMPVIQVNENDECTIANYTLNERTVVGDVELSEMNDQEIIDMFLKKDGLCI